MDRWDVLAVEKNCEFMRSGQSHNSHRVGHTLGLRCGNHWNFGIEKARWFQIGLMSMGSTTGFGSKIH